MCQIFSPSSTSDDTCIGFLSHAHYVLIELFKYAVEEDKYNIQVAMTLTAPGCGMGPAIAEDARSRLVTVPGVAEANVEIVWDPPWHQDMISEEGKMQLGLV